MYNYNQISKNEIDIKNKSSVEVFINGISLEDEFPEIKQTIVEGREIVNNVINAYDIPYRDGELYDTTNLESRVISIQLIVDTKDSVSDFRKVFNKLNFFIRNQDKKELELRFMDEWDMIYFAVFENADISEPSSNTVKVTLNFKVSDPYKYSEIKSTNASIEVAEYNFLPVKWEVIEFTLTTGGDRVEIGNYNGQTIFLNDVFETGQTIKISRDKITKNGADITYSLDWTNSNYHTFELKNGDDIYIDKAESYTIMYRERWI